MTDTASSLPAGARVAKLAPLFFALVVGSGALALAGWQLGTEPISQRWMLTKPSSALGFVLLGSALWLRLLERERRWRTLLVAGCVLGVELLAAQGLLGFAFDEALVPARAVPGHMAPTAAINLALLGMVTLLLDHQPRPRDRPALALTLLASFFGLGALLGHGYGVRSEHISGLQPMVPLSAILFTLTCLGIFSARMPADVANLLARPAPGAKAVRGLLLGVVTIPILLGLVERAAFRVGLHDTEFGVTMVLAANMLLVFALAMRSLRVLLSAERERARLEREVEQSRELAARSQTQQALQRSEEKYRALAVNAPVGIFEATLDGRCTFVNEAWTAITGYTQPEVLERGWDKVVHPDDFARLTEVWTNAIRKDAPFSLDFRYCTKSGQIAWVHGSAVPLKGDHGRVNGLMGTVVDMTERRRTLEALSASEQNFRSLVESAPFGVLVTRELKVVYANASYLKMLGFELDELLGESFLDLIPGELHELARARDQARRAGESLPAIATHVRRKDGSSIALEGDSASMLFDGEPATVSLVRDVTERERVEQVRLLAEHTLRESLREKDVLLKEVHHRVKNNLQVIVSLINLQASKLEDAPVRSVFEETRSRVHAIALLHERLYTSKNLGRIDMRDYLDGLASDLSSTNAGVRAIDLRVEADELYLIMDQAVPIGLIVNELVTNSYKHAFPLALRRGGRIEIALERVGKDLQIVVQDDGVGYPANLDPDTADSLGLLLISSLSRQLEADLSFDHRSDGARCVIRFPDRSRDSEAAREAG
ncbi:MAG TPA: PAS domain S-box protein [Polyangiales bacterium]|nr:PAS domain S-box protein [Polyangiales bacterium]